MECRHSQMGWTITIVMLAILGFLLFAAGRAGAMSPIGVAITVLFGILTILFCTLNATVDEEQLRISFGPGLVRRRVPLADIESCDVFHLPWWAIAYGLRMNLKGTRQLWRVSGKWTVDLKLASGRELFVGTDQPEALAAVIRGAIAQLSHRAEPWR
jgi:hypothetical protein